jgi:hypothetical protein
MTTATAPRTARRQSGPPPLALVLAYGVLMVASAVLIIDTPHPSASASTVLSYDLSHRTALTFAGCLGFAAALPLAIWAATIYRRLRTSLAVTAPGAVIALVGGLLAAASLTLSGLITWTTGQLDALADPALARVLADLNFATGAAGFVAPLGLLIAGIAVPGLILRLLPRWLAWAGLAIAVLSLVSTFALLTPALDFTFPVGRFLGLAWLITTSVRLPANRRTSRDRAARLDS